MIRVKILKDNGIAIIENGLVNVFDKGGRLIKEDAGLIPQYTSGMTELPIISVLSSNGKVEIALFDKDDMTLCVTDEEALQVAMRIQMNGKIVRMLRRDGKVENIRFNQLILVYAEGTNLLEKLQGIRYEITQGSN